MSEEEIEGEEFLMEPQPHYPELDIREYFSDQNIEIMTKELRGRGCKEAAIQRSINILAHHASTFIQNKRKFSKKSIGPDAARKLVEDIQRQTRKLRSKIQTARDLRLEFDRQDGTFKRYSLGDILNALQSLEYMFGEELVQQEMHHALQMAGLEEKAKGGQGDRDLDQLFDAALSVWQVNGGELKRSNTDGEYNGPTLRFVKAAISDSCMAVGVSQLTDKRIADKIIETRDTPYR